MAEKNYFPELMRSNNFDSVNEDVIRFLNKHIKQHLSIYIRIESYGEYGEIKVLDSLVPSPMAFLIKGNNWVRVEKLGLQKFLELNEFAEDRVAISVISIDGELFYPAHNEYNPFPIAHPTNSKLEIVNHPEYKGDMYKPSVMVADFDHLFLSKDDFYSFQRYLNEKESNKVMPRRLGALKLHLESKLNRKILNKLQKAEHPYSSRTELWLELHNEFDSKLFKWPASKKTIDSLFDSADNHYIAFYSRKPQEIPPQNPINHINILKI